MVYLTGASVDGNETASRLLTFNSHESKAAENSETGKSLDITVEGSTAIFMIAMLPYILFSHLGAATHLHSTILRKASNLRSEQALFLLKHLLFIACIKYCYQP